MELPSTAPVVLPPSTQRAIMDCPRHPIFSRNRLSNFKMKSWKADKNKNWLIGKSDKTLEARNFGKITPLIFLQF